MCGGVVSYGGGGVGCYALKEQCSVNEGALPSRPMCVVRKIAVQPVLSNQCILTRNFQKWECFTGPLMQIYEAGRAVPKLIPTSTDITIRLWFTLKRSSSNRISVLLKCNNDTGPSKLKHANLLSLIDFGACFTKRRVDPK